LEALGQLGINLGYLITQIVNLVLMIVLLRMVAYEPIVEMLRSRRERIAEGVNDARRAEEALASAESDKQAMLEEARIEAQRIASEARGRAEEAANQIKAEAREEAQNILADARRDAEAEKELLLADMRDQIVSLSIAAANHLIAAELSESRQRDVVNAFFTAIPDEAKELAGSLEVVTAVPLTDKEQAQFKDVLGSDDVTFTTDPGILGGVIVRAEGEQVDASFASQLGEMRAALT
jgi:F-type H+-transporting ATPase subunit b